MPTSYTVGIKSEGFIIVPGSLHIKIMMFFLSPAILKMTDPIFISLKPLLFTKNGLIESQCVYMNIQKAYKINVNDRILCKVYAKDL